ncbi:NtaA/DmoA family FMN-dependent monooxygenase [Rhodococcoides kyotonense]|uniref:FMN-dependent oxidoreductase, nitrilotriacetate monooxygenase family n=1 Tax=Rhodococcoides kyotonense TaxID=398843 RepID=A0A239IX68_9NOCA|nr:NtaA/DmoA family FMN-dependent monooxygenase [Rhodococcus kyotonensis]SNS98366.1 FMN-dependent oxidoreductase, nitrilotriacetate monooxygenase family [Rhodococcus kyotonensis]
MTNSRKIRLGLLTNPPGNSQPGELRPGDVRHPGSVLDHYTHLARTAESALFDVLFAADGLSSDTELGTRPEPVTLFSALAAVTERIGFVPTISTTFTEPFNLARQLQSLDHLTGGRVGWNAVTSSAGERNFGDAPLPAHEDRYRQGLEHVSVVSGLWDSWLDDGSTRPIDHRGEFYSVEGPLPLPRSRQGRPVLFQAGSSSDGTSFAAQFAEGVYTAQQTLRGAQSFYRELKAKTAAAGRDPKNVLVMPGVSTTIGGTEEEALRIDNDLFDAGFTPASLAALSGQLAGVDLSEIDLDDRIPADLLPAVETVQGRQSRYAVFRELAVEENLTLRELIKVQQRSAGHGRAVGSPEQIADRLAAWFTERGADGFIIMPGQGPGGVEAFTEHVVPLLQQRGLFRREYESDTLRGNLGLPAASRSDRLATADS